MRLVVASVVLVCAVLACPITAESAPPDVDAAAWLTAHGVKPPKNLHDPCCCVERTAGTSAEAALHCRDATGVAVPESATIAIRDVIWVVRGGKAVTVFDAWTAFENMDNPPGSPPMIALELTFDSSSRTITAVDPGASRHRCDRRPKPSAKDSAGERIYRQWIDRICAGRGTYRWRGRRFQR
jgi:hypothetical protein